MAYVLISAEKGREKELLEELRTNSNVKEINVVDGIYDIIVRVEAHTAKVLNDTVVLGIGRCANIKSTSTLTVNETV
ncbi:Lrp/AsnC ligand binding domain-containing protein [[Eubacterium] cellulosolvens]